MTIGPAGYSGGGGSSPGRFPSSADSPSTTPPEIPESERLTLEKLSLMLEEGIATNRREYHYDQIGAAIDAIMGADEPIVRSPKLSRGRINKLQKTALELRSMLTDIKPFWIYESNCARYEPQAKILGKLAKNWYQRRGIDQVFRDAIDYVLVAGSGYVHLFWNPDLAGPSDRRGRITAGDIDARAEDPRDVIPLSMGGDKRSIQNGRGAAIRRERVTRELKREYPKFADRIVTDRTGFEKESPSQRRVRETAQSMLDQSQGLVQAAGIFAGSSPIKSIGGAAPVTDEFTFYLHDFQTNDSKKPKEMGPWADCEQCGGTGSVDGAQCDYPGCRGGRIPSASWSYVAESGDPLYPFGRRIVATRTCILEDGPSYFHHGMFPICKITLDTFAWSWLGAAPIQVLLPIQREIDRNVRIVQDWIARSGNRGMIYDKKAVPPGIAKRFNTRIPGMKLATNPHAKGPGGAVEIIQEPELSRMIPEWLKMLMDQMEEISGIASMKSFTQLGQVPSSETIDKIIDSMTPLVRARSRSMEVFIRDFAMMLASMFMQFYDVNLRLRILGPEGMVAEDWNYRPGDLLPDYIDDDDYDQMFGPDGTTSYFVKEAAKQRGPSQDHVRNREFLRFFDFNIAPGSLLDAATITKKLLYLQLARMGLIDHWTLLEELGVQNVGKPPAWATDITKRLQAERLMGLGIMASTAGHPPSAQQMPTLQPDGVMSESG